ncbi:hypothetical protein [Streptosporangium sp. CA-115845]|uniref:hypothetical protein n=1 Tax=Streptosporangium sp. CA-115845 TaxID=3240071 RepID=UPI003D9294FF
MTNDPNLDEDTRKAVAALASRVRLRDAALRWSSPRHRGADPSRHADALAEARARCVDGAAKLKAAEQAAVDATFGQAAE